MRVWVLLAQEVYSAGTGHSNAFSGCKTRISLMACLIKQCAKTLHASRSLHVPNNPTPAALFFYLSHEQPQIHPFVVLCRYLSHGQRILNNIIPDAQLLAVLIDRLTVRGPAVGLAANLNDGDVLHAAVQK